MASGPAWLGGIVPVPVAVGISDEHRHKLLRIARKLGARGSTRTARRSSGMATFAEAKAKRPWAGAAGSGPS
jgi:hypothetical protein